MAPRLPPTRSLCDVDPLFSRLFSFSSPSWPLLVAFLGLLGLILALFDLNLAISTDFLSIFLNFYRFSVTKSMPEAIAAEVMRDVRKNTVFPCYSP